jgi:hypothetical protein
MVNHTSPEAHNQEMIMPHIETIIVNHDTSLFAELAVRSLLATHTPGLDIGITIMDNDSQDDTRELQAFAGAKNIPFLQSGFTTQTSVNTHGEIMRDFILSHTDCDYYLLLDSDICFIQPNTLLTMRNELEAEEGIFAVQARMSWDGVNEMPGSGWHIEAGKALYLRGFLTDHPIEDEELLRAAKLWSGKLHPRCHPGCALVKNTPVFRRVVEHIGLSTAWLHGERQSPGGFYDTFGLTSIVMKTHEQRYALSSAFVLHFFCVSYDPMGMDWKQKVCAERVEALRALDEPTQ